MILTRWPYIHTVIGDLPTYGYRPGMGTAAEQSGKTDVIAVINAKHVYRIMRQCATAERKPEIPPSKRAHTGKVTVGESNQRWC